MFICWIAEEVLSVLAHLGVEEGDRHGRPFHGKRDGEVVAVDVVEEQLEEGDAMCPYGKYIVNVSPPAKWG